MNLRKLVIILLSGTGMLFQIFILTILLSIPLGILVAVLSISKNKIISKLTKIYILIMRGTPLILQIICVYFGIYYLFNISCDRFVAVIIAFTINYAAYFGEIFKGGINAISRGQWEAAFTLGFNKVQTFFVIILPQVIKIILPSMSNEIITLVRDTSLSQVIGVTELFSLAQKQSSYMFSIMPLFIAGLIYLVISYLLTLLFNYTEKKLEYYR